MNVETDREFRQTRDSREWKLNSYIFRELIQIKETPEVNLSASSVSHKFLGPLKTFVKDPLLLPALKDLLKPLAGKLNPLLIQNSLQLMGWKISGRTYLQKEYQRGRPTLSQTIGKHLQSSITNQLERNGVASVLIRRYLLPDLT